MESAKWSAGKAPESPGGLALSVVRGPWNHIFMIKSGLGQDYSPQSKRNSFSTSRAGRRMELVSQLIKEKELA